MKPDIDIIIISYNCAQLTLACIESVFKTHPTALVTIVDNASTDNSPQIIREKFPDIQIVENKENRGYAGAVNDGMRATNAPFAIISNADVEFFENSIEILKNVLKDNPRIGAAGPQQVFPDGKWQRSYGALPGVQEALREITMMRYLSHAFKKVLWSSNSVSKKNTVHDVEYIDGAICMVSRNAFNSVKGFDESFFFYAEEADFCLRLTERGWRVVFVPQARVLHHRGGSSTQTNVSERFYRLLAESKMKLVGKHYPKNAKLYAQLELIHAQQMIFLAKVFKALSLGNFKNNTEEIFTIQKEIWKSEVHKR